MLTAEVFRTFLGWSTLINFGLGLLWFFFFLVAKNWLYTFQAKWFKISLEEFQKIHFALMGFFKIIVYVFNFIPWIVLHIMF